MRYIIGSVSVLLIITLAVTVNAFYVSKITDTAISYIEEVSQAEESGDIGKAIIRAEKLKDYWYSKRSYLESVLMHSEMDEVTKTISDMISSLECGDYDTFYLSERLLRVLFTHMAELEQCRLGNIL